MKIAIYGRPFNDSAVIPFIQEVFDVLTQHDVGIYVHEQLNEYLNGKLKAVKYDILKGHDYVRESIDVVLTLGGDGTMLDMVTLVRDSGTPVIGINFGRLGFLASVNKNDIAAAIYAVVNKQFTIDKRGLLSVESELNILGIDNFALNEITIPKRDDLAMITTSMYL